MRRAVSFVMELDQRGSMPRRGRSGGRYAEVARFRGIFRVGPLLAA